MAQNRSDQDQAPFGSNDPNTVWNDSTSYYAQPQQPMYHGEQGYYPHPPQHGFGTAPFAHMLADGTPHHRAQYHPMQTMGAPSWPLTTYHAIPIQPPPNMTPDMAYAQAQMAPPLQSPQISEPQHSVDTSPNIRNMPNASQRRDSSSQKEKATPRKSLTNIDRREMCRYAAVHPEEKQESIGKLFNVERSTVSKVLRKKEQYLAIPDDPGQGPLYRLSPTDEFERLLLDRLQSTGSGQELSDSFIRTQAQNLLRDLPEIEGIRIADADWLRSIRQRAAPQQVAQPQQQTPQPRNRKGSLAKKRSKPSVKPEDPKPQSPRAVSRGGSRKHSHSSLASAFAEAAGSHESIPLPLSGMMTSPMQFTSPKESESGYAITTEPYHDQRPDELPRSQLTSMFPGPSNPSMNTTANGPVYFQQHQRMGPPAPILQQQVLDHHQSPGMLSDMHLDMSPRTTIQRPPSQSRQPSALKSTASAKSIPRIPPSTRIPSSPNEAWHYYTLFLAYLRSPSDTGPLEDAEIEQLQRLVDALWSKRGERPVGLESISEVGGGGAFLSPHNQQPPPQPQPQPPPPQFIPPSPYNGGAKPPQALRKSKTMGGAY